MKLTKQTKTSVNLVREFLPLPNLDLIHPDIQKIATNLMLRHGKTGDSMLIPLLITRMLREASQ
jgi:hypothetical protein